MDYLRTNESEADDYDDDEFFGSQEETAEQHATTTHPSSENSSIGTSINIHDAFGDMGKHELRSRHHQLTTAGYLDAFDESKEERLQEGFEAGFLESFALGKELGMILGKAATLCKLTTEDGASSSSSSSLLSSSSQPKTKTTTTTTTDATAAASSVTTTSSRRANELVHEFFANDFQATNRDPTAVRDDLYRLVKKTKDCLATED